MKVQKAEKKELAEIMQIIDDARAYLREEKIPQWQAEYPSYRDIEADIEQESFYLLKEQEAILACANLSLDKDPFYDEIEGDWLQNGVYASIHRLAVAKAFRHQGCSRMFLSLLEEKARDLGALSLRIDTHQKNEAILHILKKAKYHYCGIVYVEDQSPRLAFEKIL